MPRENFSAAAARKIVDISQRCLDYWDDRGIVSPSITEATGKGSVRVYSFDDLLKLTLVKRLRKTGLSLQRIRKGLDALRKRWPQRDALLDEVLVTDGASLFRRVKRGQLEDVLARGQYVFSVVAVGEIRSELRERITLVQRRGVPERGKRKQA